MFTNLEYIAITFLLLINIIAFGVMAYDKRISVRSNTTDRIPEGVLFFLATCFGSVGIYAAMFLLRHKIRKWYFLFGMPLLIIQNATVLYLLSTTLLLNKF